MDGNKPIVIGEGYRKWLETHPNATRQVRDRRAERVMLAGMALMGLLASNAAPSTIEGCSIAALRHADALIAQLDRMEPPR